MLFAAGGTVNGWAPISNSAANQIEAIFTAKRIRARYAHSVVTEIDSGTNASLDCKFFTCLCVGKRLHKTRISWSIYNLSHIM